MNNVSPPRVSLFRGSRYRLAAALVLLALSPGCGEPSPVPAPELQGRLDAAALIGDNATRDLALENVAWVAAVSGEGDISFTAAQEISDVAQRDSVAEKCARRLIEHHETQAAVRIARLIADIPERDAVLQEIATGG